MSNKELPSPSVKEVNSGNKDNSHEEESSFLGMKQLSQQGGLSLELQGIKRINFMNRFVDNGMRRVAKGGK